MAMVDRDTFSNLVKHPNELNTDLIPQLEATIKAFPYCQISYSLLAKASSLTGTEELEKAKPLAATYALSRIALQHLVESNNERYDASVNTKEIAIAKDQPDLEKEEDILIDQVILEGALLPSQKTEEQKRQQLIIEGFMKKIPGSAARKAILSPLMWM